jgi:Zn-dependent alcohol dehydrogenase
MSRERAKCRCASAPALGHTDLTMIHSHLLAPFPFVAGHEGAGGVESVGPDVSELAPGDHVICTVAVRCGHCDTCVRNQTPCEMANQWLSLERCWTAPGDSMTPTRGTRS